MISVKKITTNVLPNGTDFVCSTVSSGINAMSTVTLEDYIKPYRKVTPKQSVWISKVF